MQTPRDLPKIASVDDSVTRTGFAGCDRSFLCKRSLLSTSLLFVRNHSQLYALCGYKGLAFLRICNILKSLQKLALKTTVILKPLPSWGAADLQICSRR